ncbi:MAG: hypothetical protein IPO37_21990 [Saprospiraceae bacterium]|nr:hypothetical protein [Saprospiraceae bacterium]
MFTTLPETDEDALYLFEIGFKLRNDELTTLKNNGTKEIQAIPLKSFNELKDEVHKRIENSRDPKVLIENELLKLDVMFINEKRSNPGYYFKLEYDRQINVTEYKHNPQEWYMSSAIISTYQL